MKRKVLIMSAAARTGERETSWGFFLRRDCGALNRATLCHITVWSARMLSKSLPAPLEAVLCYE